jgi:tetratricopeptide (TPR) repeat protein
MVQLGVMQHQLGNYEHAVSMFLQAGETEPKNPLSFLRLAQILPAPGSDDAIRLLRKALKLCLKGKKPIKKYQTYLREAKGSLIHLYMQTGRHSKAIKLGEKLMAQRAATAEDLTNLAAVYRHSGNANLSIELLRDAVADSLKALDSDGHIVWPHVFHGDGAEERERHVAVGYLHSSARDLASLLYGTHSHGEARQLTENLLASDKNNPNVHTIHALGLDRQLAELEMELEAMPTAGTQRNDGRGAATDEAVETLAKQAQELHRLATKHFKLGCTLGRSASVFDKEVRKLCCVALRCSHIAGFGAHC